MPSDFWWKKKSFVSLRNNFWSFKKREKKYLSMEKKLVFFIRNLRAFCIYFLQVLPAKSISWCHLILMKKCPWNMINFALWKWWHLIIIKGNIICWHFLKALPSADTTPLYSEGNNSIFLRQSFFPYNLRAFHTTVHMNSSFQIVKHFNDNILIDFLLLHFDALN